MCGNNDGKTGVQGLMKRIDESLDNAIVQGFKT